MINDYDYITSKACKAKNIPSINWGHQASFQSDKVPRPAKKSKVGEWMLKSFAPSDQYIGLHFKEYDDFILPPVIKKEIVEAEVKDLGHITVYLPSYCEAQLIAIFSQFSNFRFEIFSWQSKADHTIDNITFKPVDKHQFNKSLIHCYGIITGGGFETPSEAIHLGKKVMAIPIRGQYEQMCNAAALQEMNIMTLDKISGNFAQDFQKWINDYQPVKIDYSKSVERCMMKLLGK